MSQIDGRQWGIGIGGDEFVVAADDRHIVRYTDAHIIKLPQDTHCDQIVDRDHGGGCFLRVSFHQHLLDAEGAVFQ